VTCTFSASDKDCHAADPGTYPDRFSIRVPGVSDFFVKGKEVGVVAQDKWKVNSRLTASLGLRYDVEIVPIDNTGNYLFADPSDYPVDKSNVSQRLGATWILNEAGTAVVRGGWGLYYQKTAYSNFTPIVSAGVLSNSFTVTFPANQTDPGPSAGRLPTSPYLINGPIVNRAQLNLDIPTGTTITNIGTVNFDNPNRHLPYARQASVGLEKQIPGNIALSADYVHLNHRDLYMYQDLNPGVRTSTSRTAALVRIDPRFVSSVRELVNLGWADYDGLQLSVQKRQSRGYSFRVSYTYSRGYGIVGSPGATDTIDTATVDPVTKVTDLHLENREGLTGQDRPHLLSMNASVEVPRTHGLNLSGVLQYNSGTPFTLTDGSTDPNRNGSFEEPLAAGSYSGALTNINAITVENKGGVNGARGPAYFLINLRGAYRFKLPHNRSLQAHVDVFNVTNHANFNTPSSNRMDAATFLLVRSILNGGPTRTAQFNLKYTF